MARVRLEPEQIWEALPAWESLKWWAHQYLREGRFSLCEYCLRSGRCYEGRFSRDRCWKNFRHHQWRS